MEWLTRSTSRKPTPSHLLQLPAELRTLILEYALTSPKPVVAFRLDPYQADSYIEAHPLAITRVSKQLRSEALPIWYDCNTIILHTEDSKGEDTKRWLAKYEDHLPMLRHVEVWVRYASFRSRTPSLGILAMPLKRRARDGEGWRVDAAEWRWVTVLRRPADLESDAHFLGSSIKDLVGYGRLADVDAESMGAFLAAVRVKYLGKKKHSLE